MRQPLLRIGQVFYRLTIGSLVLTFHFLAHLLQLLRSRHSILVDLVLQMYNLGLELEAAAEIAIRRGKSERFKTSYPLPRCKAQQTVDGTQLGFVC